MPIVMLGSVKGAPGVTTLSAALAFTWAAEGCPARLVEFDASGGDLGWWWGLGEGRDLSSLAAEGRHGVTPAMIDVHSFADPVPALIGPRADRPTAVRAGLVRLGLFEALGADDGLSVVDLGRVDEVGEALMVEHADLALLVLTADLGTVARARSLAQSLDRRRTGAVLAGKQDWRPQEITDALGIPVLGAVPWSNDATMVRWPDRLDRLPRTVYGRSVTQLAGVIVARCAASEEAGCETT